MSFCLALAGFLSAAGITVGVYWLINSEANAERRAKALERKLADDLSADLMGAAEGWWTR